MARKKRGASTRLLGVPRHPNGRIYHKKFKAQLAPPRPYFAYAQRLMHHDPKNAAILLIAAITPDRKLYQRLSKLDPPASRETLMKAIDAAEDPRIGYPLGILWARGLLCPAPVGFESSDEKAARDEEAEILDKSGRLYAAQHYLVWRWQASPCQEAPSHLSHLERTLDELGIDPPTELDPEEFEKERRKLKAKLEGARRALMRAAPMGLPLKAVDRICIDGFAGEVHPGALKHLIVGLRILKEHYNVRLAKSRDRSPPTPSGPPYSGSGVEVLVPYEQAAVPKRRLRLPANLTSDPTLRPTPENVAKSVAVLLKEGK